LLTSVGAVVPTTAVRDKTGAAPEGIVPPRVMAAAMPIESTHTKFFMRISFRLYERSNLQFVPYIPVIVFTFFQIGDDMR
jgi:hypothetical protein